MHQAPLYATRWKQAVPLRRGLKNRMRIAARNVALGTLAQFAPPTRGNFLRCLYCHYVFDDQADRFAKIIRSLRELAEFVDTDKCLDMLEGRRPVDGRFLHLSFDDGFHNIFRNAAPVLRELQVPAIVFVPTALVGAGYEPTRDYCLEKTRYDAVVEMTTWDELRTLTGWGFTVGSHTRTHARFSELSGTDQMESEIAGSKADLERELGVECKYISWPYGKRGDADTESLEMTRRAGYRGCFGAFRGTVMPGKTSAFSIPRHHFEPQWPIWQIQYFASGHRED
jgi:peptidoglycan/xylan/chitin deacetylase (PgdA/CDA1 family)